MTRYMLDTNIVTHLVKGHQTVGRHVASVPMVSLSISAITEGELRYGLAKRPQATTLRKLVEQLLLRVEVLPWEESTAERYGTLRARLEREGKSLAQLDLLIAAHALATDMILVTNDRAFDQINELELQDWTA